MKTFKLSLKGRRNPYHINAKDYMVVQIFLRMHPDVFQLDAIVIQIGYRDHVELTLR